MIVPHSGRVAVSRLGGRTRRRRRPRRVIRGSGQISPVISMTAFCRECRFATREPGEAAVVPLAVILPGTGGLIVGGLGAVAVISVLLWIPVVFDRFNDFLSRNAPKAAPKIFLVGFGFLLPGLVFHVLVLDVVGASMIGLLMLGLIYDNY